MDVVQKYFKMIEIVRSFLLALLLVCSIVVGMFKFRRQIHFQCLRAKIPLFLNPFGRRARAGDRCSCLAGKRKPISYLILPDSIPNVRQEMTRLENALQVSMFTSMNI